MMTVAPQERRHFTADFSQRTGKNQLQPAEKV